MDAPTEKPALIDNAWAAYRDKSLGGAERKQLRLMRLAFYMGFLCAMKAGGAGDDQIAQAVAEADALDRST